MPKLKAPPRWWAAPGLIDNHNYTVSADGVQRCHLCGEFEPPLRVSSGDEHTDRAAAHLVHGVRVHLDVTAQEWSRS